MPAKTLKLVNKNRFLPRRQSLKIGVIGAGPVGLTTAACLAHLGYSVICVDNDHDKITALNKDKMPFYEPELDKIVKINFQAKRLKFSTKISDAVKDTLVIFITVGTPTKSNGEPDLTYIKNALKAIGSAMNGYKLIVEKSTVPVMTCDWIKRTLYQYALSNSQFDIAYNPEFLREGSAVADFLNPDRIVLGVESEKAKRLLLKIYQPIKAPKLITDIRSAELIKHSANAFLATKISFINAVSIICELTGADIEKVATGLGLDKRIGPYFLKAGIGFGGFCLPKDLKAFIHQAEKIGYDFRLLKEVEHINIEQRKQFIKKLTNQLKELKGKQIGVLGLAFKPNTDDVRSAPSIEIIKRLKSAGAKIKAYDPKAIPQAKKTLPDIQYCNNPYEVAKDSDCLVILTEWQEFRNLDLKKIKQLLKRPIIFDGRNIFELQKMREMGFIYHSIGRVGIYKD
ncbi:MAG: UDP-glucose/GDP-mannose dehydrogenase family protein [candidate division WOR-3 bacterium]|nr:UDP-glucose/GDP-mannose dehydrogenase family protein [candidate division WOR-3 bacterium]